MVGTFKQQAELRKAKKLEEARIMSTVRMLVDIQEALGAVEINGYELEPETQTIPPIIKQKMNPKIKTIEEFRANLKRLGLDY